MKAPVVFYSWQSDLPNKTNRGLIKDALEKACKELSADLELAIRTDAGVEGQSGSPDIAATILEKMDKATVVVADVSLIGVAPITGSDPPKTRPVPNPNVVFELGYAKRALGPSRVIMVCNTAYGPVEDLPFDIRGKSVVPYAFKTDDGDKPAGPRNDLAARLRAEVAAALEAALASAKPPDTPLERFHRLLDDPNAWKKRGEEYIYCVQFPEFTVVDGETYVEQFREPWTQHFPDKSAHSFEIQLRCHATVLETVAFVVCVTADVTESRCRNRGEITAASCATSSPNRASAGSSHSCIISTNPSLRRIHWRVSNLSRSGDEGAHQPTGARIRPCRASNSRSSPTIFSSTWRTMFGCPSWSTSPTDGPRKQ